jgi:hypothetical protein
VFKPYVPVVRPLEVLHIVPLAPSARFADNGENRHTDIGKGTRAIAGYDGETERAAYVVLKRDRSGSLAEGENLRGVRFEMAREERPRTKQERALGLRHDFRTVSVRIINRFRKQL